MDTQQVKQLVVDYYYQNLDYYYQNLDTSKGHLAQEIWVEFQLVLQFQVWNPADYVF